MSDTPPKKNVSEKRSKWRGLTIIAEIFVVVLFALVVLAGYGAWRIHEKPLDIGFAKPYLEAQLKNPETGMHAKFDQVMLHWPDLKGPILVGITGARVLDVQDREVIIVNDAALGLARMPLLAGKVVPNALILRDTDLQVKRNENNEFTVGFEFAMPAKEDVDVEKTQTDLVSHIIQYLAGTGDAAIEGSSPLVHLKRFKLENIRLFIDDDFIGLDWQMPRLDLDIEQTSDGLEADYALWVKNTDEQAQLKGRAVFNRVKMSTQIKTILRDISLEHIASKMPNQAALQYVKGILGGDVSVDLNPQFQPYKAQFDLELQDGVLHEATLYNDPLPLKVTSLKGSYKQDNGDDLSIDTFDIELDGVPIKAHGNLKRGSEGFIAPLHVEIPKITQAKLKELWPNGLEDLALTKWITSRVSGGVYSDFKAGFEFFGKLMDTGGYDTDIRNLNASAAYADTKIQFLDNFSPVEHASGTIKMDSKSDTVRIDAVSAKVQGLNVVDGYVVLSDVMAVGKDSAVIELPVQAQLSDVFRFVTQPRIGVNHGFNEDQIQGAGDFTVTITLPTLDDVLIKDIDLKISGKGQGGVLPGVLSGLDLSGFDFTANLENDLFRIDGSGVLDGRSIDLIYKRNINLKGAAKPEDEQFSVTAKMLADPVLLHKLGADVNDYVSGKFPSQINYTHKRNGTAALNLSADTKDTTFMLEPFKYRSLGGENSTVTLAANFVNDKITSIEKFNVKANGLNINNGRMVFKSSTKGPRLSSFDAPRAKLGETVGKFVLNQSASGGIKFDFDGDIFDLRPFLKSSDKKTVQNNPPLDIKISAQKVLTNENEHVSNSKVTARLDDKSRFDLLKVNAIAGRGVLNVDYGMDGLGRRKFYLAADDAGAALNAFGVYTKARDGKLVIEGMSATGNFEDRTIIGNAHMIDFRVRKAPILGKLLSALSLPGLIQLVDGDGVVFAKMATDFTWQYRPGGALITLKDGRTSGNSLGLTFDGKIDLAEGRIDSSGTIIPLSGLNKKIGEIPVIGDILTGGSDSMFAATYQLKGSTKDPNVSVNPLSVLAPGILRGVLFENKDK